VILAFSGDGTVTAATTNSGSSSTKANRLKQSFHAQEGFDA
jgi:hypothetical protein